MTFQSTIVQKKLEDAGFDPKQALGLAAVLESDVVANLEARFVTREYLDARLAELKAELKTEIGGIMVALKTEISGIKFEMIKWMAGMIGGSTLAIIVALLRLTK